MEQCVICKQEHERGSPDWRDCQDKLFDHLVDHPEEWEFVSNQEHENRVFAAYESYEKETKTVPDVDGIRLMLSRQFLELNEADEPATDVKGMTSFWQNFASDMPGVFQRHAQNSGLELIWTDRKIKHILHNSGRRYMDWQADQVTGHMKAPATLENVAREMRRLEREGYALYDIEYDPDAHKVRWYFRKSQVVEPPKEESDDAEGDGDSGAGSRTSP